MSLTSTIEQTLRVSYAIKIVNDFHRYLDDEEYDSEVLMDDLKEEEPFFIEYIVNQNPSTFPNETQKQQFTDQIKQILDQTEDADDQDSINNEELVENDINDIAGPIMSQEQEEMASMKLIQEMKAEEKLQQQQNEEQMKSDEQYARTLFDNENVNNNDNPNNNINKLNDNQWSCQHCTFINDVKTNICSMCNKTPIDHKEEEKAPENESQVNEPFILDEKWNSIYQELEAKYLSKQQCAKYYSAFLDIVTNNRFEMDDAEEDLNEFATVRNESLIAEGIIDKFGWKVDDINTSRLINCFQDAFAKLSNQNANAKIVKQQEDEIYKVKHDHNCKNHHDGVKESDLWKTRIANIIGLKHDSKHNKKLAKYNLFAQALTTFGHRELCCFLRLWIRQKMFESVQEFNNGLNVIKFIRHRFEKKSKQFDDEKFQQIFKIGFNHKLMAHNSILRKLNPQYHVNIDIPLIQIWLTAIVMRMNQYDTKYQSCHSVFCLRFKPQKNICNFQKLSVFERIQRAYKLLDQTESKMITDDCWIFVVDFTKLNNNNEPEIAFESRDVYDDEVLTERKYNSDYKLNQLYHLKKLDYIVSKQNDNSDTMALQLSFHKYWANNCVSWLTHSSGHVPFFEDDIIHFIPKLFKNNEGSIKEDEWEDIVDGVNIKEIKSMDRMYSELEQSYDKFMDKNEKKQEK